MADFSIAKQCDIVLKAESEWKDSQSQTEMYNADAEVITALATEQVGRNRILTDLQSTDMDDDEVKVVWIDNCEVPLDDACQNVCDFTGGEAKLKSKKYKLTKCKSASFSIDENDLRRNAYTPEEYVANQFLVKTKALDEYLNKQGLLFLSNNAGYNKNQGEYTWKANSMQVPQNRYDVDLMVDMVIDAKVNLIKDPFLVDSGTLFKPFLKAELEKGDSDGSGSDRKSKLFRTYFDLIGFPTSGITDNSFLVAPGSYAFANRSYNPGQPTTYNPTSGWQQRWSMPSFNIPGVAYDVYYKYECSGKRFKHTYLIQVTFDFLLNPEGCGENAKKVTGILSYKKAKPPVPTT